MRVALKLHVPSLPQVNGRSCGFSGQTVACNLTLIRGRLISSAQLMEVVGWGAGGDVAEGVNAGGADVDDAIYVLDDAFYEEEWLG